MARALALALALVATNAFVPGAQLRQRAAPMSMLTEIRPPPLPPPRGAPNNRNNGATNTRGSSDYLSNTPSAPPRVGTSAPPRGGTITPPPPRGGTSSYGSTNSYGSTSTNSYSTNSYDSSILDPESARRIRQMDYESAVGVLVSAKEAAVAAEDYDAAKRLKRAEDTLRQFGGRLAQLEVAKRQAVGAEDYDRAKLIKADSDLVWDKIEDQLRRGERADFFATAANQPGVIPSQEHMENVVARKPGSAERFDR